MTGRILTQLCRTLSGKPTTQVVASEFTSTLFPDLLKPQTLRLVTTLDFCHWGREMFCASTKLSREEEPRVYLEDLPPSCQEALSKTFWFEMIDVKFVEEANKNGAAFFFNPFHQICRHISYDKYGRLRSDKIKLDDPASRPQIDWFMEEFWGALFALYEMPSVCMYRSDTPLKVPPFLKTEQSSKEKSLFSTVYLAKKFSDAISEGTKRPTKERQTLDISGRRYHWVLPHYYHYANRTKRTWKKLYWRGDIELGVVRKIYKGSLPTDDSSDING